MRAAGTPKDPDHLLQRIAALEAENATLRAGLTTASAGPDEDTIIIPVTSANATQRALEEEKRTLELLNQTGAALAAELDLDRLVQIVTDAGTKLVGAEFGAFFYNTTSAGGDHYMLYALSGVAREAFSKFPMPRNTEIFAPTFAGASTIRSDDITRDPRYGKNAPHSGMPAGHLPVRSYLAVPVVSRTGTVLGGLFFGHSQAGIFTERAEHVIKGISAQAAIAVDNARLLLEVRHSERRFRAVIEHSADAIAVIDPGGFIRYASPAATVIEGRTTSELIGSKALRHSHPTEAPMITAALAEVSATPGASVQLTWRRKHRDGHWLWIDGTITNLRHDPAVQGTVVNYRDATARKRVEEAQAQSQKMEALGTLAGGIAHDFNNILLAISGNTRLAIEDLPGGHASRESLEEVAKASQRAIALVNQILTFSRQQESSRTAVDLQSIVREALDLLRATLPATIAIRTSYAADTPQVIADSTQVHQIMMNLATNAAHAIGNTTGTIAVGVSRQDIDAQLAATHAGLRPGSYVCLMVNDTGCGMERATQERIYDPFFTTKPAGQGTGLGLSVVHGIMRGHDGAIVVHSEVGKGTTFRLYFPAAEAAAATAPQAVTSSAVPAGNGERVLYIDDDEAIVFLISRILDRLGYKVTGLTTPEQGLEAFKRAPQDFDVVVTDMSMPGMSGFELVAALRAVRSDVVIRMTSGYVRPEDNEAAHARGLPDIILKPNSVEELGKTLHQLFRK